jgi:hypothetical protein
MLFQSYRLKQKSSVTNQWLSNALQMDNLETPWNLNDSGLSAANYPETQKTIYRAKNVAALRRGMSHNAEPKPYQSNQTKNPIPSHLQTKSTQSQTSKINTQQSHATPQRDIFLNT